MINILLKPFNRQTRALLGEMVRTDFKLRYQNSFLGYLWSLIKPLLLFSVYYLVFGVFLGLGRGIPGFPVYLITGIVLWTFFAETTNTSVKSIVSKGSLIRKIKMPRYLIVASNGVSALVNFSLNMVIIALFIFLVEDATITPQLLILLPLLVLELFVFAVSVSFILAAMYVKFRDISYIWEVAAQALFYATAIIYPLQMIPELAQKALLINPVAQVVHDIRRILVYPETIQVYDVLSAPYYLAPFAIVLATLAFSVYYFRKHSKNFAENL